MSIVVFVIVLFLVPVIICVMSNNLYSGRLRSVSVSAISAVFVYLFILGSVTFIELKLDAELTAFDINGDGVFSGSEITPEQEKAMHRVIADTGRTFAPITGAVFSIFYFLGVWLLLVIIKLLVKMKN
ncbi:MULTISPECIES: hypothetical protein [unclassified Halomonas]|uniref:hypothetical protein n=1 Tax=unclassified Halomonas TaxID=2609666 RepID=UPI0007D924B7|nr:MULTISPECIES: hypothetical protein [unclassified Halomonas]MBT2785304.1 hypothetical protein [Halomonas sp. ISL-106]MBT2799325.1 hypothetical protein [Halomonas sp. ISL-104]OAL59583.1 hypothetical protein A6R74_02810 [Halomonas sp. ALS9]